MSDSDMTEAAQQLLQLSDEDNNSSNSNNEKKKKKKIKGKRLFEHSQDEINSAKIEEIFGKEEGIYLRLPVKKQPRYRFLESIYKETKPIKGYANNLWY